ncbi:MAG: GTP 3',8-cyclase MoaA [Moraxella sp.]
MKISVPHIHAKAFDGSAGHSQFSTQSHTLTDGFLRRLTYLRFSVTDFCNFRCSYCLPNGYQGKRPDDELTLSEINTLFLGFASLGTTKIRLTGGEPTVRRDLPEIIQLAKSQTGIKTVAVSTNGYKLAKHISAWQEAKLNQINLSVDSFDANAFKRMTGFDILPQLLKDVDKVLETTDIRVKMNGILTQETAYHNLMSALAFVKNRPVTYRFIEFMQTSDNNQLFFAQHQSGRLIKEYLTNQGWQPKPKQNDSGPAIEYTHPDYLGSVGIIEPYAKYFCDSCNRLRVSSLGKVHLCLFDSQNYDIRPHLTHQDIQGLKQTLSSLMPIKPEHHHLNNNNSGLMNNLSLIGG